MLKRITIILLFFISFWVFFGFAFRCVMQFDYLMAGFSFALGMMSFAYLLHWKDEKEINSYREIPAEEIVKMRNELNNLKSYTSKKIKELREANEKIKSYEQT